MRIGHQEETPEETPLVSVIVATFNRAAFLENCIRTLIGQRLLRAYFEIIVVDDGSTDDTMHVLAGFSGVRIVRLPENRGVAEACNRGLELAAAPFVVRVDSDDEADPDLLRAELEAILSSQDATLVICDYWKVSRGNKSYVSVDPSNIFTWVAAGVMVRKDRMVALGGYRPLFWEEFDLYLRLLQNDCRVVHIPRPLLSGILHGNNMTGDRDKRLQGWKELVCEWGPDALRLRGWHPELAYVIDEKRPG